MASIGVDEPAVSNAEVFDERVSQNGFAGEGSAEGVPSQTREAAYSEPAEDLEVGVVLEMPSTLWSGRVGGGREGRTGSTPLGPPKAIRWRGG